MMRATCCHVPLALFTVGWGCEELEDFYVDEMKAWQHQNYLFAPRAEQKQSESVRMQHSHQRHQDKLSCSEQIPHVVQQQCNGRT